MPYIDVDLLKESVLGWDPPLTSEQLQHMIDTIPFVEVVRCEKCKDFEAHGNGKAGICRNKKSKPCLRYSNDFCSNGERRDK